MTDDDDLDYDVLEQEFLQTFADPLDHLYLNPDKTGEIYEWSGHTQWTTESAVESVFADRLTEPQMSELSRKLNDTAPDWLSRSDL